MKKRTHLKLSDQTKGSIWNVSESELNAMLIEAKKGEDYADYETRYMNIIRPVFDLQYLNRSDDKLVKQLQGEGFSVFSIPNDGSWDSVAIRKRQIKKITDLTAENVLHLSAAEVLELIEGNLGTGWQGLPLAIQDIIESAFYVDSSVMPAKSLHRKGGLIDRRKADGYEVLEIERGTWIEAIFLKLKPRTEKVRYSTGLFETSDKEPSADEDLDDNDEADLPEEDDNKDDAMDEEEMETDVDPSIEDLEEIADEDLEDTDDE